jgi:hypothetical protein
MEPSEVPEVVGWVEAVTVDSLHAPVTSDTCTDPPAPRVLTKSTRLTRDIELTATPAGNAERLNLRKVRVEPAPAVAPTCSKGADPKLTAGNAVLTCASSEGAMAWP